MSEKILIVDDQPDILKMFGVALESEGYQISVALNGEEAIQKIANEKPDLIILDIMLPGMSGLEVCNIIRSDPNTEDIPIIMLSAKNQTDDKVRGLRVGADDYITKPIEIQEFIARVAAHLRRIERMSKKNAAELGYVYSFIGAKGGVGTTTVMLNVAMEMVRREKQVLVVELNPGYSAVSHHLGFNPRGHLGDLLEIEPSRISENEIKECISKHPIGLHILCGPTRIVELDGLQADSVEALFDKLARMAEYVILDLPPYPSTMTQIALERSNVVALVLEPVVDSMEAARQRLGFIQTNTPKSSTIGIVLVNRQGLASSIPQNEIESQLGIPVFGAVPRASDILAVALSSNQPLVVYKEDHIASIAMVEISNNLIREKERI